MSTAACIRSSASPAARHTPCIFEYVYFARPDSIIDNISVHKRAHAHGRAAGGEDPARSAPDHDIDVVIPIPDTSRTSAMQVAQLLGVKYREGFVKNRYIGRTFIMPGQEQRAEVGAQQAQRIDLEFRGKNVLLVDDSIVRGTTSAQIIDLAREAGAKQGLFRLGRAAGELSERVRHRHAGRVASWSPRAAPKKKSRSSSAPTG